MDIRSSLNAAGFGRRLRRAVILPIVIASLLAGMFMWQVQRLRLNAHWVDHADRVIAQSIYIQKLMLDTVTGIRGFVLTGEDDFLEPFDKAERSLGTEFSRLRRKVSDNDAQVQRVTRMERDFGGWSDRAREVIALKRKGVDVVHLHPDHPGKKILDQVGKSFEEFVNAERELRNVRSHEAQRAADWTMIIGLVLALFFGLVIAFHTRHSMILLTRSYESAIKELESALQLRDDFLSIASHELKTPLTSLKLQLQMTDRTINVGDGKPLPLPRLKKALRICSVQSQRLASLVDDLLDISRIQAGKLNFAFEETDLAELVNESIDRYRAELAAANCPIELNISAPLRAVCDPFRIDQVIVNLLSNAMKYGAGQPITVTLVQDGPHAVLSIEDGGIGIPRDKHQVIFDRFERAVSSSNFGGLGLGLYIARQIIEAHHGTISVESELQKGATFVVKVPLDAASPSSLTKN